MTDTKTNNTSVIVNGNIESSYKTILQETIYDLVRQKKSYLEKTNVIVHQPFDGQELAVTRAGAIEFDEVTERNQKRKYSEYVFDRIWTTHRSWEKSFIFDRTDIKVAIEKPTSAVYRAIIAGINKLKDKVVIAAAVDNISIGSDAKTRVTKTAEEDGVITVDATSEYNFDTISTVSTNFKNCYIDDGIVIAQSPNEEKELLRDSKLMSRDYETSFGSSFSNGSINKTLGCNFISNFSGSDNGTNGRGKLTNPILPEDGGFRYCVALASDSIQMGMLDIDIDFIDKLENYVNSSAINVFVRAYALRLEGCKVQKIKVTI